MNTEKDYTLNPKEAHDNVHAVLGDEAFIQYNNLIKQFSNYKINRIKFGDEVKKLLNTTEKVHLHNVFVLSLSEKIQSYKIKSMYLNYEESIAEEGYEKVMRYVTEERYIDEELIKTRLFITAFQQDLDCSDDNVTKLINIAVQTYMKNILNAVISKQSGYRIRENSIQHSIGYPVPNPWLRNCNNIVDETQESPMDINEDKKNIQPKIHNTLEQSEQQTAFTYLCSTNKKKPTDKNITLKGLYETLLEDPTIISNHTIFAINLERILSKLECL